MKTRITELLGIEYPILAGPMASISHAELVSAVSNAGGLGILVGVTFPTSKDLREEVKKTKSMTDKPFGVNITMLPSFQPVNYEEYITAVIEEGVNIIETSGRSPEPLMKLLKDSGVKTLHRATRTRDIQTAERVGVDAVTILGTEAAGHPGQEEVTSMVRIPIAAAAVNIPVIAAGGIADARGLVAALALGAEAVLTPAREGVDGAIRRAHRVLDEEPVKYYMPNQFDNENNVLAHYDMTGPEILDQTEGEIDVFVAGMGTTGTLVGTGKYLKEKKQDIKIVGVEPPEGHAIQGLKNMNESIVPKIYHAEAMDEKVTVEDGEAFEMTRLLAVKEGIFVGMSSGAAVAGALRVAKHMNQGTIVAMLPDRGDRYLSTTLFRSICAKCPP